MSRRRNQPDGLIDSVINAGLYGDRGGGRMLLYRLAKDNESFIKRMTKYKICKVHTGCVNSICWNETGDKILSGSDDQRIKITDPFSYNTKILLDYKTPHRSNIFCARFLPLSSDARVVSCSGDGLIHFTHVDRTPEENLPRKFNCHDGTCYKLITVPNEPHSFMSCGEDTTLRYFDLRAKESCSCVNQPTDVLISATRAITSMAVNPLVPWYLAVGTADSSVTIFDRRKLTVGGKEKGAESLKSGCVCSLSVPELENSESIYRITSLNYSSCGKQILASYSSDYLYLFDTEDSKESKLLTTYDTTELSSSDCEEVPSKKVKKTSKPQLRRLRLRGDWSDTGPNARPQNQPGGEIGQARPTLQQSLMERMTFVLSQMLNDISSISGERASNRTNGNVNPPSDDEEVQGASGGAPAPAARESGGGGGERSLSTSSEQLEDQLGYLRSSFVSRHNVEPGAVSLSYREGGSNAELISVSNPVVDEIQEESPTKAIGDEVDESCKKWPLKRGRVLMKYTGHRNARTMIKEANFYGDRYVLSGSDCGHVFIWEKRTGQIVQILEADNHVVNNVQPHPFDPVIATSGIDYDIKLFAPVSEEETFNLVEARELMKRNEVMLEETKDTITVPAAFMIRMLSCLSHIRRLGAGNNARQSNDSDNASSQSARGEEEEERRQENGDE